ncbi:hypothetical protein LUZ60_006176 [Juncus effusus]|nr:hypothetical protein LUZ60_006176 [Juncus effusus]
MGGFSFRRILVCLLCILCHKNFLLLSAKVVESLPGFSGPLPFYLETGYVTVDEINGGELFYYYIKSEAKPSGDPLLLWLTGGHRCSALSGLIFEVGPFKIVKALYNGSIPEIEYHPYAWTKHANVIFLDSPLGAGFSFSSNPKGYEVGDTLASAQIQKFLKKWFADHPEYVSHSFFIAGDSYAGKIVPVVAQLISEDNDAGQQPFVNLKGYLVGNPSTGEKIDQNSRVPYAHGVGIISDEIFEMTQKSCAGEDYSNPTKPLCAEMMSIVNDLKSKVSTAQILEPHCDLVSPSPKFEFQNRRFLRNDESVQLLSKPAAPAFYCREYSYYLSYFWANDNAARAVLGNKKGTVNEWHRCAFLPYKE